MLGKKRLSFIIPVYNEQENLYQLYEKLKIISDQLILSYELEIILINDGSSDSSWTLIKQFSKNNTSVKGISFTRNFGHQIALTAGYDYAIGDAVISLDADLQHPPDLIINMVKEWENGFPIVYARRKKTKEGFLKNITSKLYVKILNTVSGETFPQGVADFRLIDAIVVKELKGCSERFRYLRGAIATLGFPYVCIDYDQPGRERGFSKYTLLKMLTLAFNGLVCFSTLPLRVFCYLGFILTMIGGLINLYALFKIYHGLNYLFWQSCMTFTLYCVTGSIFLLLWVVSEYAIRMYESLRQKKPYTIFKTIGFKNTSPHCYHRTKILKNDHEIF